jgi:methionyl-tRNA formyltransferase
MAFRIVFFGTSEFAVPPLAALAADPRFRVAGLVTQPDRPVGRHAALTAPATKRWALERGASFEIRQPEKMSDPDFRPWIETVGPSCDAFVVVSYGKILPQWLLDLPRQGVVNVHGSVLPRWRGASPIHAAIAAGDASSGVTVMKIDALMDHGPILATVAEPIRADDTAGSLHDRLAMLGGKALPDTLAGYLEGRIVPQEQDHAAATHCKILSRDDGKLDPAKPAAELERLVRGMDPWPGTWMEWNGKRLKVLATALGPATETTPGSVFVQDSEPLLACGNGSSLRLLRVQPEGKSAMDGTAFANGLRQT